MIRTTIAACALASALLALAVASTVAGRERTSMVVDAVIGGLLSPVAPMSRRS